MYRIYLAATAIFVAILAAAWVTDFVTLQGEWTVYTAACEGGAWQDGACTGKQVSGPRYRFRALKVHREVLFWTAGERSESGRFSDCTIQDGRNWTCPPNGDAKKTITHEMVGGKPQPDANFHAIEFHRVPKWRWELLNLGSSRATPTAQ